LGAITIVDPANANEMAEIAREVGADVLMGDLSYPSGTSGWQLGDLDLGEYLAPYRGQRLVLIIVPIGDAPKPNYTCGICGFVMNEAGDCPRCKLAVEDDAERLQRASRAGDIFGQVRELLDGDNEDSTAA
jgi:hypothetical protein